LAKHMRVEDRDLRDVRVNIYLNNEVWFRGIKKPPARIKVKAIKRDGIVYAELAEIPEKVKFDMEKHKRIHAHVKTDKKASAEVQKPAETEEEKKDTSEKEKASAEAGIAAQKTQANRAKHTIQEKHKKVTAPVRMALKK